MKRLTRPAEHTLFPANKWMLALVIARLEMKDEPRPAMHEDTGGTDPEQPFLFDVGE